MVDEPLGADGVSPKTEITELKLFATEGTVQRVPSDLTEIKLVPQHDPRIILPRPD